MPGKLRVLSGSEVVQALGRLGFEVAGQKGSHVKLRRIVDGQKQTLVIPMHTTLDRGTVQVIYRQAQSYVDVATLRPIFYID